jgi:hypothetical protein
MTATARKRDPKLDEEEGHERARVASLTALQAELKAGGALSREDFSRLFARAQRVLELDDVAVARALQIARPTVGRWARGESAPHPLGRKPALSWLAKQAAHKLAQHAA